MRSSSKFRAYHITWYSFPWAIRLNRFDFPCSIRMVWLEWPDRRKSDMAGRRKSDRIAHGKLYRGIRLVKAKQDLPFEIIMCILSKSSRTVKLKIKNWTYDADQSKNSTNRPVFFPPKVIHWVCQTCSFAFLLRYSYSALVFCRVLDRWRYLPHF